ncbi:DUF262 domain-containing protein [Dactylosporangium sp. NPDC051541]|uniref:DUF262 domain-containing protein n=1 Tax=Dactylosporangium sp. NPDC051541 TaxID=3363977 RepID=UPI0037A25556
MATFERPRIEQLTPEDLVREVLRGVVRIPQFQRGFKWEAGDVVKLFDSILRGFPIGNLLLWRRPAPAQTLEVGPLIVQAPNLDSALWVVDGQQRITSIVGALVAAPTATDVRFRVHLDLESGEFHTAGIRQQPPDSWIPVSFLLDTATLPRRMRQNGQNLSDEQIERVDQAAAAIRESRIPAYVVTTDDEKTLLEIFTRSNTAGKRLTRSEIFQALHSRIAGDAPATLAALGRGPAELGFGAFDDRLVLRCVLAYRGSDVFGTDVAAEFTSAEDRAETFGAVAGSLRDVVTFLRDVAEIPHVKLMPYPDVIPVLIRFVRLHGAPEGRAATLLRRWVWRGAVAGAQARGRADTDLRGQIAAVEQADPVAAAAALLARAPANGGFTAELDKADPNLAMAKINILCLWAAEPREPATGLPVDIARLLDQGSPVQPIVGGVGMITDRVIASGPRFLLRTQLAQAPPEVAESHLIDRTAQRLLAGSSPVAFLDRRAERLNAAIKWHVDRMAEWGARDGRSIADMLRTG